MFKSDHLQEKWEPVLNHGELEPIKDSYRKAVTAVILENQERAIKEERGFLSAGRRNRHRNELVFGKTYKLGRKKVPGMAPRTL